MLYLCFHHFIIIDTLLFISQCIYAYISFNAYPTYTIKLLIQCMNATSITLNGVYLINI